MDIRTHTFERQFSYPDSDGKGIPQWFICTIDIPIDPANITDLSTILKGRAYFRVKRIIVRALPADHNTTLTLAFANADARSTAKATDNFGYMWKQMEDYVYKVKGRLAEPVSISRTFQSLPWCEVLTGHSATLPTISIGASAQNSNSDGCKASNNFWFLVEFESYGTTSAAKAAPVEFLG